jgi:hypothetical protein
MDVAARALGVELSRAAVSRLERFEGMLADRAVPMGLVAPDAGRLRGDTSSTASEPWLACSRA